jgi:hypothetical protein
MCCGSPSAFAQGAADLYQSGCAACHGVDGRGVPRSTVGFETPLPDFTDCEFTTSEADFDWNAVVHLGGPARALDRSMPAFGDALSQEDIQGIIEHVRGFCTSRGWPHGDLNLPRPLVTNKAFPENEAFVRVAQPHENFVETRFVYERRIAARSQIELIVPFNVHLAFGRWQRGLGDMAVGFKHVLAHTHDAGAIVSAGAELTFPTGKEELGLGNRLRVLDTFAAYGQLLPANMFLHVQLGLEAPLNIATAEDEVYWRTAGGITFAQGIWGRAWSPMIELLGARELYADGRVNWVTVPQLQVTLSRRQHIAMNIGMHVPLTVPRAQPARLMAYLLWDWFDGSPLDGW